MRRVMWMLGVLLVVAPFAAAQDPTEVDPDHYQVVFENDAVRVVRITYAPGDKSVMHYHPDGVAVFFTDQKIQFTMPDDTTQVVEAKARDAAWIPGGHHLPENLGDEPLELILVELKGGGEE